MESASTAKRPLERFSLPLLAWYDQHRRDLPWRRSRNPYHIWVSEVMLQQTRVETVIPYYYRFIDRFPTIEALADAPEEELLKQWEGLGYYSRARNLQAAVREVTESYGGRVPDKREQFGALKGVGPYTTGAVLSIAYNKPEPAVDGNVMRVLARFFLIEDDIVKTGTRQRMEKLARELIPEGRAGDFNQALMELGATVCTPRAPYCLTCPVMETCAGRLAGREASLPVKTKAKPPRPELRAVVFVRGDGANAGRFLVRQRPAEGLLARMWELPHAPLPAAEAAVAADATAGAGAAAVSGSGRGRGRSRGGSSEAGEAGGREMPAGGAAAPSWAASALAAEGLRLGPLHALMRAEHTFSHIHWDMQVYAGRLRGNGDAPGPEYRWIAPEEMERYAFPNVFLRIIRSALNEGRD